MEYELQLVKNDLKRAAKMLGDYQELPVENLMNGYCLAKDTADAKAKERYMSAFLLRQWHLVNDLYTANPTLKLERTDFLEWLYLALDLCCEPQNRIWQREDSSVNAQTAFMQTLNTRFKAAAYYESNLAIHKANYNSLSLDDPCGNGEDDNDSTFADNLPDYESDNFVQDVAVESIVQGFINHNQLIEAIIIDNIAFNDAQRTTTETIKVVDGETGEERRITRHQQEFWPYKLRQILSDLPDTYKNYFMNHYRVNANALDAALTSIKNSNSTKLYKSVDKTLNILREAYAKTAV